MPAYRTVPTEVGAEGRDAVAGADIVTFTSASTVERFLDAYGPDAVPPVVACIGPITADAARQRDLHVDVVAEVHTLDGLVDALLAHVVEPETRPARRRPARGRRRGGSATRGA